MKKVGIICEYNPFHNGHVYHLEKIKELYPDSLVVLVLGGYFLERGEISLISKWNKTKIALDYGVDLVIELPTLYGTNSSDYFAYYAIKALDYAGVDCVVFGSESADLELLKKQAKLQNDEKVRTSIKDFLKKGFNYPTSIMKSLGPTLKSNDLLGVSYIKAIDSLSSKIEPALIKRTNDYNDTSSTEEIVSASNIRERIKRNEDISKYIPDYDTSVINKINEEKVFEMIKYKIITEAHLEEYLGVDEGLENRLKKVLSSAKNFDDLVEKVKSKRYTTARIRRMLIHILIGYKKCFMEEPKEVYRVLGFNLRGRKYLKELSKEHFTTKNDYPDSFKEYAAAMVYTLLTDDSSTKLEVYNRPIIKK